MSARRSYKVEQGQKELIFIYFPDKVEEYFQIIGQWICHEINQKLSNSKELKYKCLQPISVLIF